MNRLLLLLSTFLSALLLFVVQPLYAKHLLPFFGGTSAVWTISIFFYSATLLLGYLYAAVLMQWPNQVARMVHGLLLLIGAGALLWRWGVYGYPVLLPVVAVGEPALAVLMTLACALGVPIVLLASTTIITQHIWARLVGTEPYALFAVSNAGSLFGLLLYPFLLEPFSRLSAQATAWLLGYFCFNLLLLLAWRRVGDASGHLRKSLLQVRDALVPHRLWILLWAAIPTFLLASVTELLSRGVASFPLLWVLPLALYLVSFILVFGRRHWDIAERWLGLAALAALVPTLLLLPIMNQAAWWYAAAGLALLVSFFLLAVYFHQRVYTLRPAVRNLGPFYVYVTLGGAIGSGVVGFLLPVILPQQGEVYAALALITLFFTYRYLPRIEPWVHRSFLRVVQFAVVLLVLTSTGLSLVSVETIDSARNFYGTVRVKEGVRPVGGEMVPVRTMVHGATVHGLQALDPQYAQAAASYYGPDSGIDLAIRQMEGRDQLPRVAVIGLGAGMMNAYCSDVALLDYIEINPAVVELAREHFTYLDQCAHKTTVTIGDGRLALAARDAGATYDIIMMDAFSDDAIPTHLLTTEAFRHAYAPQLAPGGIIAFHISNKYLNLAPPIAGLAAQFAVRPVLVTTAPDHTAGLYFPTVWLLLTDAATAAELVAHPNARYYTGPTQLWSDEQHSVLSVLSLTGSSGLRTPDE
mgnify:CR=1 FL=1